MTGSRRALGRDRRGLAARARRPRVETARPARIHGAGPASRFKKTGSRMVWRIAWKKFDSRGAEPGERQIRVADERPQDPAHLGTDQGEDDHPETKDRLDVLAQDPVLERVERTGRLGRFPRCPASGGNGVCESTTLSRCSV